jgi:hypothetical protein
MGGRAWQIRAVHIIVIRKQRKRGYRKDQGKT